MRILVADDCEQYRQVAVSTLAGHVIDQAASYEEAIELLTQNSYDGVLSDLFFPSLTDWLGYWTKKIEQSDCPEWALLAKEAYLHDFRLIMENPSGLMLALECKRRGIPCLVVSQGEYHHGDLGKVRMGIRGVPEISEEISGKAVWHGDPFVDMLAYVGEEMDKLNPSLWEYAAAKLLRK